jgi:hypothetical protein
MRSRWMAIKQIEISRAIFQYHLPARVGTRLIQRRTPLNCSAAQKISDGRQGA